ncbi:MAG TPA: bifunctional phosphopantothenoylcysteine decarboxylase/phosphopantothenate--cysteine ligase CoaBC [Granulicella sp.]
MADPIKVTVGVTGGIAAYKAVELVRLLQQAGLDPHVVMTDAAQRFVTPLTFAAITGHKVITSLWSGTEGDDTANLSSAIDHIDEAQTTRLLVVVPATAGAIAKFAHGLADDFLSTLYLATTAPVLVAPAMNVNMWNHPATQANLQTLRQRGVRIVAPGEGYLACGMVGNGRLADPTEIAQAVLETLQPKEQPLLGETVLITAGGTREPLDPVRFLGNRSSGRMGYALAAEAVARGAKVILVSAPVALEAPAGVELVPVTTAAEMHAAVLTHLPRATVVIGAAAVADFRPAQVAEEKIRRNGSLTLTLEPTPDILADVAAKRAAGTVVIAFAAETASPSEALSAARAKLQRKGADAIVLNDVSNPTIGFDVNENAGVLVMPEGEIELPFGSKQAMAARILEQVPALRGSLAAAR